MTKVSIWLLLSTNKVLNYSDVWRVLCLHHCISVTSYVSMMRFQLLSFRTFLFALSIRRIHLFSSAVIEIIYANYIQFYYFCTAATRTIRCRIQYTARKESLKWKLRTSISASLNRLRLSYPWLSHNFSTYSPIVNIYWRWYTLRSLVVKRTATICI